MQPLDIIDATYLNKKIELMLEIVKMIFFYRGEIRSKQKKIVGRIGL